MTDRYAVIGNPVAHSRSPWIHAQFALACGQDIEYDRIEAPIGGFAAAAEAFRKGGGKGLNVTLPFKQEAYAYSASASPAAHAAGAVNTLVLQAEAHGENTDGTGLIRDIGRNLDYDLNGRKLLLMGAGGAAQGVVGALLASGISGIVIANRTPARAEALAARFPPATARDYAQLAGEAFDVLINATSAGLAGEAPALPDGLLHRDVLAYDMVYGRDTPFLAAARAAGARACDGLGMLVEQAAESFFLWRGIRPETRPVLERLRAL